jgi:hypothetical protein
MALVAIECFEIDLVQNDSQEIVVDAAGRVESVFCDVDPLERLGSGCTGLP